MSANDQGSVSKNVSTILSRKARVKKRSLAEQAAETLREAIIRNDLEPGMRLVELEIAQQMGMSQAPVREALQRLEQDGLVERRSRSATYVSEISMDEMYEINLVRKLVETLAICQTAEVITAAQCDHLEQLVGLMKESAERQDMATVVEHDLTFHSLICEWSGKETLVRVWLPLVYQTQRFLIAIHPQIFPDISKIADLHIPIISALRANDPDAAVKAIEEHIMKFWNEPVIQTSTAMLKAARLVGS
ncbi:MAG: GntR family transcriptional regulator [Chloroflexi bacterium]|nr:GntR family transcriptional regulator [Chloroflexota bacterium]